MATAKYNFLHKQIFINSIQFFFNIFAKQFEFNLFFTLRA